MPAFPSLGRFRLALPAPQLKFLELIDNDLGLTTDLTSAAHLLVQLVLGEAEVVGRGRTIRRR